MKEARIIIGVPDVSAETATVLNKLENNLALYFGGFTKTVGKGGWVEADSLLRDDVAIYDIAIQAGGNTAILRREATRAGYALRQSVYIRYPDGEVVMIACPGDDVGGVSRVEPREESAAVKAADPIKIETDRGPKPREVWQTRNGSVVYVSRIEWRDGLYDLRVIALRAAATTTIKAGDRYCVSRDGRRFNSSIENGLDLFCRMATI